ncbi:putative peptide transport system permease protein BAB2_1050 [Rhodovastum atsumiense]|uniref:ABC transporter permease n=1 Tax=Rhodovastum atsumiense TaxID=504468 RepID=A0A5M6IQK7_9PROT|nr:ABC transporter permease [Rhodovastum atsumiense]KAA5610552.1 ABC transporter permease [Rhodovastum atsumiense]CAH2604993.1 putative peptide transport system permease protein BAB2_1050 [Rhodovastum atsumiense]
MFAFIISRLLQAIPVLLVVGFISFAMFAFVGDPVSIMLGQDATEAQRQALVQQLGLDQPFLVQYAKFMWAVAQGQFGISYRIARPVSELILERLPATVELAFSAALLALAVGVPMGVYTGIRRHSPLARAFMVFSLLGVSLPTFLIGILLILVFSVVLGWLPSFGRGEVVHFAHWSTGFLTLSGLRSLVLPAVTLAMFQMTLIMRLVRAEMLEVLRSDYIKFARARGLSERVINFGHALKNTLVPVITIVGLQIGGLLAFSIVTETVFQWPGMGLLLVQSIGVADIPVMSAYLLLIAVFFVLINLIVDLLYYAVDPRLRLDRRGAGAAR